MTIKQNLDNLIIDKINEFNRLGGCLEFKVFNIDNAENPYQAHLETAKATLIKLSIDCDNRNQKIAKEYNLRSDQYFKFTIDFDELENLGIQIFFHDNTFVK